MNPYEETLLRARDAERARELRSPQLSGVVVRGGTGWMGRLTSAVSTLLRRPAQRAVRPAPVARLEPVDPPAVVAAVD